MKLSDLVRDEQGISATKCWSHVGNAVLTACFVRIAWNAQPSEALVMLFAVFGGLVVGSRFAHVFIKSRSSDTTTGGPTP